MLRQALQLTSLFENGTIDPQYDYVEKLPDGRGWTCGIGGFTEEEGEYFESIIKPEDWKRTDFDDIWKKLCKNVDFRTYQECVVWRVFYRPAYMAFRARGCVHNLTLAVFYDTVIQHGDGSDPDSFGALLKKWNPKLGEKDNLTKFLHHRADILKSPTNKDTAQVWRESLDRVVALEYLLETNIELKYPIIIKTKEYDEVILR
jgi:chitosanase